MNYTKGEWKATNTINNFVVKQDNFVVAKCYQNLDNAKLIAEAPRMYEAVMTFLKGVAIKDKEICRNQTQILKEIVNKLETKK